ncbi:hypothetical protein [Streptomyces sp. bgisy034]
MPPCAAIRLGPIAYAGEGGVVVPAHRHGMRRMTRIEDITKAPIGALTT